LRTGDDEDGERVDCATTNVGPAARVGTLGATVVEPVVPSNFPDVRKLRSPMPMECLRNIKCGVATSRQLRHSASTRPSGHAATATACLAELQGA
jgi:hypothetical protein